MYGALGAWRRFSGDLALRLSGGGGTGLGSRNISGLWVLRMASSWRKSIRLTLEAWREWLASEMGGLDLELATLLNPELAYESSDRPESEGVCTASEGKSRA